MNNTNNVDITEVMQRFKEDTGMSEAEWHSFCRRYYNRNVSSVAYYLEEYYGKMPRNINALIKEELAKQVASFSIS